MSVFEMELPDVGEGVAEAELVSWFVDVGDVVTQATVVAEVLTDKATVEISAPVAGVVAKRHGDVGDILAVGSRFISIETDREADAVPGPVNPESGPIDDPASVLDEPRGTAPRSRSKATAAPAVRARAVALGIDLGTVSGTGPEGRVTHDDLDRAQAASPRTSPAPRSTASAVGRPQPVRGVRRQIAQRLSAAWSEIPHITYVESVDVTELGRLRDALNSEVDTGRPRLTILPFLVRAMAVALRDQPDLNAHYNHDEEVLTIFDAVHVGIATQTPAGLRVPVVRDAEALDLRELAAEIARLTNAAKDGNATRADLAGSTITISSLGALGGIMATPILNAPEVAIVGVNKIEVRPLWTNGAFQPRQMLNLSSSFDHRMVDGWDAALFVHRLKTLLETPALLFVGDR